MFDLLAGSGILVAIVWIGVLLLGSRYTDRQVDPPQAYDAWDWRLDPSLQVRRDVSRHARMLDFAGYLARLDDKARVTGIDAQENV